MKRFVFTLKAVYDVAVSTEKQQKTHLQKLAERLALLHAQLDAAQSELIASRSECQQRMQTGITSDELASYSVYFESMVNIIAVLIQDISKTQDERDKWIAEYIKTRNKIQALDRMREAQLEEYRAEVKKEEDSEIGDILSFRVAVGERA